jgi:hypothetical protein
MLSATNEHIMLGVIMQNVIMLNVVMLGVIMLNVVMLNIVAPPQQLIIIHINWCFSEATNSPDNLSNVQRHQHKVNAAKDASLFHQHFHCKFTSHFRLHFWHQLAYFGTFFQMLFLLKSLKVICAKDALL